MFGHGGFSSLGTQQIEMRWENNKVISGVGIIELR